MDGSRRSRHLPSCRSCREQRGCRPAAPSSPEPGPIRTTARSNDATPRCRPSRCRRSLQPPEGRAEALPDRELVPHEPLAGTGPPHRQVGCAVSVEISGCGDEGDPANLPAPRAVRSRGPRPAQNSRWTTEPKPVPKSRTPLPLSRRSAAPEVEEQAGVVVTCWPPARRGKSSSVIDTHPALRS